MVVVGEKVTDGDDDDDDHFDHVAVSHRDCRKSELDL
jgi:hypothetical protein